MLQSVDGKLVFVVEFDKMPELPIVGVGMEQHYAEALTQAIMTGLVRKPGKYGIEVDFTTGRWNLHKIIEDEDGCHREETEV